jgi:hypothetical protein
MGGIRLFVEGDVPQVADVIWRVLRRGEGPAPSTLKSYVQEVFFHNPWLDEGIHSRVYEDSQGKIVGFFGAVPRRMSFRGKPIRMAFGSSFVMDPASRVSLAGVHLVRAFMTGKQDVSITDSANEMSTKLLRSLGFSVVPVYSLIWARPLRPSRYALYALSRLNKSRLGSSIASVTKPFGSMVDALASRVPLSPFRQSRPCTGGKELDIETHLDCLARFPSKTWLVPDYNRDSLSWLLSFIIRMNAFGDLRRVAVYHEGQKVIGWFIYSVARGGVGEVLQIGADSPHRGAVLDHLFYDAWKLGLVGLHGRLEPQFMEELTKRFCFFSRWGSWTLVHSKQPELPGLIQSGNAFFSRLEGEWCLRFPSAEA